MNTEKAYARRGDVQSSHDAANSITSETISEQKRVILAYLKAFGPATLDRITRDVTRGNPEKNWSEQSIRSRTKELERAGLAETVGFVRETGKRVRVKVVGAIQ